LFTQTQYQCNVDDRIWNTCSKHYVTSFCVSPWADTGFMVSTELTLTLALGP